KSLRGIKMEDVIFAGTRDRKPTGMAEVSLTLVDPEVYDGPSLDGEPEIVIDEATPTDWDETSFRQQNAAETEEAVAEAQPGTTRFKTKKRLAELRLEAARLNLSRVNDIFDEVTRQMTTLKRQASKAERYGALRDELRTRLRVVLASRMSQLDLEQTATTEKINTLATQIEAQAATVETMDTEHTEGVRTGYTLDQRIREAGA